MIEWLPEPSSLGLFNEATAEECEKSKANKDACYTACVAMGATGWNLIFAPYCTDICMNEACGNGIILTPHDMQKAGAVIGTCMQQCVDDAKQLPEANGARAAALAACGTTCNMAHVLEQVHAGNIPTTPPKKSNAVWWVLGGLAAVVGGYFLVKGGGVVAAFANPALPSARTFKQEYVFEEWEEGSKAYFVTVLWEGEEHDGKLTEWVDAVSVQPWIENRVGPEWPKQEAEQWVARRQRKLLDAIHDRWEVEAGKIAERRGQWENPRSVRERIQKELDGLLHKPGVTMHGRYGASYGQYNAAALDAGIEARQRYAESWRRRVLELPGAITETKIKTRSYRHTPVLSWRVFTNGETWVAVSSRVNVGAKTFTREEYEKWISHFYEVK